MPFIYEDEEPIAPVAPSRPPAAPRSAFEYLDKPTVIESTAGKMQSALDAAEGKPAIEPEEPTRDPSWGSLMSDLPGRIGARGARTVGGMKMLTGQGIKNPARLEFWQSVVLPRAAREAEATGARLEDHPDVIEYAKRAGTDPSTFTAGKDRFIDRTDSERRFFEKQAIERMREGGELTERGRKLAREAGQQLADYDPQLDEWSTKSIAFDIASSIPDLIAAAGATVVGGPGAGGGVMFASTAPSAYADALDRGLTGERAGTYAALYGMAEVAPEIPVLSILAKTPGGKKIMDKLAGGLAESVTGRVAFAGVAEGISETVTEALQMGIDVGLLDETTPLPEALERLARAGVVGAGMGVSVAGVTEGVSAGAKKATDRKKKDTGQVRIEPTLQDLPGPDVAATTAAGTSPPASGPPPAAPVPADLTETQGLRAVRAGTATPEQVARLEAMGLVMRNEENVARLLPEGRRRLAAAPQTEVEYFDERLKDEGMRKALEGAKSEIGWHERGGRVHMDSETGEVLGRSTWIGPDLWRERPSEGGRITAEDADAALTKAAKGEKLSAAQKRFVSYVLDYRQELDRQYESVLPDWQDQDEQARDLTRMADEARRHASDEEVDAALEALDDTEAAQRLRALIDRGYEGGENEQAVEPSVREDGQVPLEASARKGAQQPQGAAAPPSVQEPAQEQLARGVIEATVAGQKVRVNVEPTAAQKEAGNYQKGTVEIAGLRVAIENPRGSVRRGKSETGEAWERRMPFDYGYVKSTEGADGDQVDVYIGPNPKAKKVFVVDQMKADGTFDEHKALLGFNNPEQAKAAYARNYPRDWKVGPITEMTSEEFGAWVKSGKTKKAIQRKPQYDDAATVPKDGDETALQPGIATYTEPVVAEARRKDPKQQALDLFVPAGVSKERSFKPLSKTALVSVGEISTGITNVDDWRDAAHLIAPLRKHPQENLVAIVADKSGEVLGVVRHSLGTQTSAPLQSATFVGSIARIKGAAMVYMAHNHPGGSIKQSDADERVTSLLDDLFRDSGIKFRGSIVIGTNNKLATLHKKTDEGAVGVDIKDKIPPRRRKKRAQVLERRTTRVPVEKSPVLSSPTQVKEVLRAYISRKDGSKHGVMLLDNNNAIMTVVDMDPKEMAKLRTGDPDYGTLALLKDVELTNASGAVVFGEFLGSVQNVTTMLTQGGLRVIDQIETKDPDNLISMAETTGVKAAKVFFSRKKTRSSAFKKWFGKSKVVDENGDPLVVYHGTTGDFDMFDRQMANTESDFGAGIYFTNTREDASANYAGEGPDLTNRIDREVERLDWDLEQEGILDPVERRTEAERRARDKLGVSHQGMAMPAYLKMENPFIVSADGDATFLDYEQNFNEDGDPDGDGTGALVDFIVSLRNIADEYSDGSVDDVVNSVMEVAIDGGISADKLHDIVKNSEKFGYYTDDKGDLVSNEIFRRAIEAAGFDGIIDRTVDVKFGIRRRDGKSMAGMREDTVHYIVFEPNQIKSAIGNRGTFSSENPSILMSREERRAKERAPYTGRGMSRDDVAGISARTIHSFKNLYGVQVKIAQSVKDLPQHHRQVIMSRDGTDNVQGFYDGQDVWLIAENLAGEREVVDTIYHEVVGHFGLRQIMAQEEFDEVMDGIWKDSRKAVMDIAAREGFDVNDISERRFAAEEVAAYMAAKVIRGEALDTTEKTLWQKIIDAVRRALHVAGVLRYYNDRGIAELIMDSFVNIRFAQTNQKQTIKDMVERRMSQTYRSQRAPLWYSPMIEAIASDKVPNILTPKEWLNIFESKTSIPYTDLSDKKRKAVGTGEIRAEELKWYDIQEWLANATVGSIASQFGLELSPKDIPAEMREWYEKEIALRTWLARFATTSEGGGTWYGAEGEALLQGGRDILGDQSVPPNILSTRIESMQRKHHDTANIVTSKDTPETKPLAFIKPKRIPKRVILEKLRKDQLLFDVVYPTPEEDSSERTEVDFYNEDGATTMTDEDIREQIREDFEELYGDLARANAVREVKNNWADIAPEYEFTDEDFIEGAPRPAAGEYPSHKDIATQTIYQMAVEEGFYDEEVERLENAAFVDLRAKEDSEGDRIWEGKYKDTEYSITGSEESRFYARFGSVTSSTFKDFDRAKVWIQDRISEVEANAAGFIERYEQYTLPLATAENYQERLVKWQNRKRDSGVKGFTHSHFDMDEDFVAHVRALTTKSVSGKRILFLDELQSDWHQEMRDKIKPGADAEASLRRAFLAMKDLDVPEGHAAMFAELNKAFITDRFFAHVLADNIQRAIASFAKSDDAHRAGGYAPGWDSDVVSLLDALPRKSSSAWPIVARFFEDKLGLEKAAKIFTIDQTKGPEELANSLAASMLAAEPELWRKMSPWLRQKDIEYYSKLSSFETPDEMAAFLRDGNQGSPSLHLRELLSSIERHEGRAANSFPSDIWASMEEAKASIPAIQYAFYERVQMVNGINQKFHELILKGSPNTISGEPVEIFAIDETRRIINQTYYDVTQRPRSASYMSDWSLMDEATLKLVSDGVRERFLQRYDNGREKPNSYIVEAADLLYENLIKGVVPYGRRDALFSSRGSALDAQMEDIGSWVVPRVSRKATNISDDMMLELTERSQRLSSAIIDLGAPVPVIPPLNRTWPIAILQWAIREAAANGLDGIAIAPGSVHSVRWGATGLMGKVQAEADKESINNAVYALRLSNAARKSIRAEGYAELGQSSYRIDGSDAVMRAVLGVDENGVALKDSPPATELAVKDPLVILSAETGRPMPANIITTKSRMGGWVGRAAAAEIESQFGELAAGPKVFERRRNMAIYWPESIENQRVVDIHHGQLEVYNSILPNQLNDWLKKFKLRLEPMTYQLRPASDSADSKGAPLELPTNDPNMPATMFTAQTVMLSEDIKRQALEKGFPLLFSRKWYLRNKAAAQAVTNGTGGFDVAEPGSLGRAWNYLVFKAQDKFTDLLATQRAAEAYHQVAQIPDDMDAYLQQTLFHGKTEEGVKEYEKRFVEPLVKLIKDSGYTWDNVEDYLYARHAPEANAYLAKINSNNPKYNSGMTDAEAAQTMRDLAAAGDIKKLQAIGATVDVMTKWSRDQMVMNGLEDQSTVQQWEQAYKFYVPLKGWKDAAYDPDVESIMGMPKKGRGFDVGGKLNKQRTGRTSRAANILANVVAQGQATIILSEKAKVTRAFYEFVVANPSPRLWSVNEVEYSRFVDPNTGLVRKGVNPTYKLADNVIRVKYQGKDYHITLSDQSPQMVRLAAAMKNLSPQQTGVVLGMLHGANRVLSALNTSLNPEFTVTNALRDLQTALVNVGEAEKAQIRRKILRDWRKAWWSIRRGERGKSSAWAQEWEAFKKAGAKVGWIDHYKDPVDLEKKLQRMLGPDGSIQWTAEGIRSVGNFIETENLAVENAIRLSTFVNLKAAGMSEARAAAFSKDLTVNFNRKGDAGVVMNSLYLFYNASVQGTARLLQAAKHPATRRVLYAYIAFGMSMDILNRLMGGDDEDDEKLYDKISEQDKERNIIIMLPKDQWRTLPSGEKISYLKIPLPYGFNVLYYTGTKLGKIADRAFMGNVRRIDPMAEGADIVNAMLGSFSPIGTGPSLSQWLAPTAADPFIQINENIAWHGGKLMPEDYPGQPPSPDSQKFYRSVPLAYRDAATYLNRITGGTEISPGAIDISPATMQHWTNFATGGLGRFLESTINVPHEIATAPTDLETREIAFVRKVVGGIGDRETQELFYGHLTEIERARREIDAAYEMGLGTEEGRERMALVSSRYPVASLMIREAFPNFGQGRGEEDRGRRLTMKELRQTIEPAKPLNAQPQPTRGRRRAITTDLQEMRRELRRVEARTGLPAEERKRLIDEQKTKIRDTMLQFNKRWNEVEDATFGERNSKGLIEKLGPLIDGKSRRDATSSLRKAGLIDTASLLASLPPIPDRFAREQFALELAKETS